MNVLFELTLKIWLKLDSWLRLWILSAGGEGRGGHGTGRHGMGGDSIDNLSPSLWLLAWLGSALAEVCQYSSVIMVCP